MTKKTGASDKQQDPPNFDYSSGAAELRGEVYRPPEYLEYLEKATVAMRTVRLIVYAGMTGFVILAFYGFFLIYRLTTDVHLMLGESQKMTQQMQAMTRSMVNMNQNISVMSADIDGMSADMAEMNGTISNMSSSVARMQQAVTLMQHSATNLDRTVSPMMGTLNSMMPFGWPGNYGGPPPYAQ
ncbi:hypothetical protein [Marimonas arenosa]|uniref:Uncharacterized protein n=1 Tax=Marimonas arenosa TaxID=1795305 RepID=A0AAE3WEL4_9RHOB|nr:hypothetical protein [Marimonas arenosa]MDQ2090945.1 hypothetical protein [Marimonas arenosa]